MKIDDLFDRMASELTAAGAVEDATAGTRSLSYDGTSFARLTDTGAEVFLPEGTPARQDALDRDATAPAAGGWVGVPIGDPGAWPRLFEQALQGVRRS